ncbi:Qnr family pentapeptide repeat protein [Vibrio profundi]|uniref:Qnr family pentapeptide repeat protein n=1 Tax=Vibrio profundi TaxID=1774960 RepID=UPI00373692F8
MHAVGEVFEHHDFSKQDLANANFKRCKFYLCDFSRADLREAKFDDCSFIEQGAIEGCDFEYADLRDASFKDCQLSMANFKGANAFGIELRKCDLKGANFAQVNFVNYISSKVYFCSAFITGSNLSYANFEKQCLEKCELFENKWRGANLLGASLIGSDLSRGEFSQETWGHFQMQNCDLTHCDLEGLDIHRVDLSGVKICEWQQEQLLEPLGLIVMPN